MFIERFASSVVGVRVVNDLYEGDMCCDIFFQSTKPKLCCFKTKFVPVSF